MAEEGLTLTPDGQVYITTDPPGPGSFWSGGYCFNASAQLHVSTTPAAGDYYIGGRRFNADGALVVGSGTPPNRPYFANNGFPFRRTDGGLVRQVNQTPDPTDPYVHGVRVGPLGGVYMVTSSVPPQIESNPVITLADVGVASQHTPGVASGTPPPTITLETWKVDGVTVGTGASYTPTMADYGKQLTVTETWTNTGGSTDAVSAPVIIQGAPPAPVFDFDFLLGVLPPEITFTRTTVGTYFDASGIMQTAAINAPRFDHDPISRTPLGLLIETQRTNLVLHSGAMANGVWTTSGDGAIVTGATAPDGSSNACTLTCNGGAMSTSQLVTVTPGTAYVWSFYAKLGTAAENKYSVFDVTNAANIIAPTSYQSQLQSGNFVRVSVPFTAPAGCTSLRVYPQRDNLSVGTVILWGGQLEVSPAASSYIATTTAILSRTDDLATVQGASFTGAYDPSQGTVSMDSLLNMGTSNSIYAWSISDGAYTSNSWASGYPAPNSQANVFGYTGGVVRAPAYSNAAYPPGLSRIAANYGEGFNAVSYNGGAVQETAFTQLVAANQITIGRLISVSSSALAWVQRFRYWGYKKPNSELPELTEDLGNTDYLTTTAWSDSGTEGSTAWGFQTARAVRMTDGALMCIYYTQYDTVLMRRGPHTADPWVQIAVIAKGAASAEDAHLLRNALLDVVHLITSIASPASYVVYTYNTSGDQIDYSVVTTNLDGVGQGWFENVGNNGAAGGTQYTSAGIAPDGTILFMSNSSGGSCEGIPTTQMNAAKRFQTWKWNGTTWSFSDLVSFFQGPRTTYDRIYLGVGATPGYAFVFSQMNVKFNDYNVALNPNYVPGSWPNTLATNTYYIPNITILRIRLSDLGDVSQTNIPYFTLPWITADLSVPNPGSAETGQNSLTADGLDSTGRVWLGGSTAPPGGAPHDRRFLVFSTSGAQLAISPAAVTSSGGAGFISQGSAAGTMDVVWVDSGGSMVWKSLVAAVSASDVTVTPSYAAAPNLVGTYLGTKVSTGYWDYTQITGLPLAARSGSTIQAGRARAVMLVYGQFTGPTPPGNTVPPIDPVAQQLKYLMWPPT